MRSCIMTKETTMTKIIEVNEENLPPEVREALKELSSILGSKADKLENLQKFKEAIGSAVTEAVIADEVDPLRVVHHLLVLAALTLTSYFDPKDGVDPRKAFGKLARLAHDAAMRIREKSGSVKE